MKPTDVAAAFVERINSGSRDCPVRKKAEARPRSLIGIVWKLHTYICPGWKAYQRSLKREVM
jgi:hypothetical protein